MASSDRRIPGLVGRSALEFAVVSNPATPDRTAAIRGLAPSPLPYLIESARLLERLGASHIAYPCNTAHYFLHNAMDELALRVPLVDMIDETVRAVAGAGLSRIGLLATTGTISTGLYQDAFETSGIATLVPGPSSPAPGSADLDAEGRVRPEVYARLGIEPGRAVDAGRLATLVGLLVDILGEQEGLVMEAIRGPYGVKAGYTAGVPTQLAAEAGRRLVGRGADALVLGCTELPLVLRGREAAFGSRSVPLVDPTTVVAERLLALDGRHGIAGGLGPEATIDLLVKMHAPGDFTDLQYDILRSTVADLGARRDQDHLKLVALATPDPVDAARRLAEVGASFLVLARTAADARDAVATATNLTTLVDRPGSPVGHEVVRRAAGLLATP
jgi:aspartate racemase